MLFIHLFNVVIKVLDISRTLCNNCVVAISACGFMSAGALSTEQTIATPIYMQGIYMLDKIIEAALVVLSVGVVICFGVLAYLGG